MKPWAFLSIRTQPSTRVCTSISSEFPRQPQIPGFALWRPEERRYVLRFYPPVPVTGDTVRDTQAVQSVLETVIRAYPDQWLWIHRRWKTRPPGAPSLYETEQAASEAV